MSDHEPIEPLPPALAALFAREPNAYVEDPVAKAAVRRRVLRAAAFALPLAAGAGAGMSTGAGASAAAATWSGARVAVLVGAAFLGGGVVGGVAVWGLTRDRSPSPMIAASSAPGADSARVASSPVTNDGAPAAPLSIPVGELPSSRGPRADGSGASAAPSNVTGERGGSLARERETIDAARAALVHGRYDEVLRDVHKHEVQWPHGALEEEREALAIQALAGAGRRAAAEERAARFRRAFPGSMLSDVVDAALKAPPPP